MSWPLVPLGDLVNFYSGGTPSKADEAYWSGDVPWFSARDMKTPRLSAATRHLSEDAFERTPLRKLPAGTVTLVVRGMILAHTLPVAILDVPAAINQDLKALLPRRELDPGFLAAMLRAQQAGILAQVSTAAHGTKKLDSRVLENVSIPFPPIEDQRRVAAILDHTDSLRSNRLQAIAHLDALVESVLVTMFGAIPVADYAELSRVATVSGGLQISSKRNGNPLTVPYLRVANVYRGRLKLDEVKTLRATAQEVERTRLEPGDLLVVEGHGNREEVGRCALWPGADETTSHQNHLIRIRPDPDLLLPAFGEAWLNSSRGRRHLTRSAKTTSGLNTISTSNVRTAPVPVPPREQQYEFARRVAQVRRIRTDCAESARTTERLFASLQAQAFQGRL